MIILVVDDLRLFPNEMEGNIVHHEVSSRGAIKFLEENFSMISDIFLDFYLGGKDTTMPVVNWLWKKAEKGQANHICSIRIITSSPTGAQKIATLSRYFYIGPRPQHIDIRGFQNSINTSVNQ